MCKNHDLNSKKFFLIFKKDSGISFFYRIVQAKWVCMCVRLTRRTLVRRWESGDLKRNRPQVSSSVQAISMWWWVKSDRSICGTTGMTVGRDHFLPSRLVQFFFFLKSHLEAVQRVRLGEHLELGQLANESHRLVLCLDVDLVLLTDLRQQMISNPFLVYFYLSYIEVSAQLS